MRMVTGSILVLASESAFAHALLIGFPHQPFAHDVLLPASASLLVIGAGMLIWGILRDRC